MKAHLRSSPPAPQTMRGPLSPPAPHTLHQTKATHFDKYEGRVMPAILDALILREGRTKDGLFGIGLQINPKTFCVQRINRLIDKFGVERFTELVRIGDVVITADGKMVGQDVDITAFLGEYKTTVTLRPFSKERPI